MSFEQIVSRWKQEQRNTAADYRVLLDNFRIIFAYHSGKIENEEITLHDTREIFENGRVINYTGDLRNLFEIKNQKDCFDFLLECVAKKEELTVELICELHRRLMKGCYMEAPPCDARRQVALPMQNRCAMGKADETRYQKGERPGEFKIHDYVTGDGVGAAPEDVEMELQELLEEVKEEEGKDVMTIAAYFHLRFEEIHPFADGNGRLGRTLLNYYLMTHDYPPLVLFEEDKKTYYMALTVFDKTGKIDGFLAFLREQMVKTWERKKKPAVKLNMLL
ncbi:MAG: Fic family protein [Lachnospiraceae bacterium]|nr:Fic family protein [Lachnospiraceae bacterium]